MTPPLSVATRSGAGAGRTADTPGAPGAVTHVTRRVYVAKRVFTAAGERSLHLEAILPMNNTWQRRR